MKRPVPVRRRVQDEVFDAMVKMIVTGQLQPGERLREADLMAWSGASRTPVREALSRLALARLVEVEGKQATRVAAVDTDYLRQVAVVLSVLLSEAANQGVPLVEPRDLRELADIRRQITRSPTQPEEVSDIAQAMWLLLLDIYGNEISTRIAAPLMVHVKRVLALHLLPTEAAQARSALRAIVDGAEARDGHRTAAAVTGFFDGPLAAVIDGVPAAQLSVELEV